MTTVVRIEQSTPVRFRAFLGSRIQNGSPARVDLRARVGLFLIATLPCPWHPEPHIGYPRFDDLFDPPNPSLLGGILKRRLQTHRQL